jgi:hypothetical protein
MNKGQRAISQNPFLDRAIQLNFRVADHPEVTRHIVLSRPCLFDQLGCASFFCVAHQQPIATNV